MESDLAGTPRGASEVRDYEQMVEAYNENLTSILRGFRGDPLLDMWVPDEDHAKSITNLVEAAHIAGLQRLSLFVARSIASTLKTDSLVQEISAFGSPQLLPKDGGFLLDVTGLAPDTSIEKVHRVYREGLKKAARSDAAMGDIALQSNEESLCTATLDGARLSVAVNSKLHAVTRAAYSGEFTAAQKGMLEVLCGVIVGLPVLETGDHALIRVEHALRDKGMARPVPGIVTPENADPVFSLGQFLVRKVVAEYRSAAGVVATENNYSPRPPLSWVQLSDSGRLERINSEVDRIRAQQEISPLKFEVLSITGFDTVIIGFSSEIKSIDRQSCLMALERMLKERVEPTLQLYGEELKDRNAIRRL